MPSGPAQQELIRSALADAGLAAGDVAYVEAHGTGTAVGDPIEVEALAEVHAERATPLLIGSVKSNVGHLEWAAGICGVIKVMLAMHHGRLPPSLHVDTLNPRLDWDAPAGEGGDRDDAVAGRLAHRRGQLVRLRRHQRSRADRGGRLLTRSRRRWRRSPTAPSTS